MKPGNDRKHLCSLRRTDRRQMNQNSKPKYEVIMEDLLAKIHSKDFSYDTVFCTEKQLSEQYKVSRIIAKRAITEQYEPPGCIRQQFQNHLFSVTF